MLYTLHYLNRRGSRVWEIPLAGTTITRASALLPVSARNPTPLRLEYHDAQAVREAMNRNLTLLGIPGKVFTVIDLPHVDLTARCREVAG